MSDQCAQAYVEYDLACEPLKFMRGQIVVDFIVEHRINDKHDLEVGYVTCTPWKLYFDGSVCDDGQGISDALISLNGAILSSQTSTIQRNKSSANSLTIITNRSIEI